MSDRMASPHAPKPSSVHAALIAAEATMRHNDEVAAVFVVTSGTPGNKDLPRDVVTILRMAETERVAAGMELRERPHVHVPHWAKVLLDSTEGVR